jgi:hypothetical protein
MQHHPHAPSPGASTTTRRLPSGAIQVGPWTVAARPGRVYLAAEPDADTDLRPDVAIDLAAALLDQALTADAHALDAHTEAAFALDGGAW